MLSMEVAQERLKPWLLKPNGHEDDDEDSDVLLKRMARLDKPLRTAGYALFERDAEGKRFSGQNWQEKEKRKLAALVGFDEMTATQRLRFFAAFFPKLADDVEHGWQLLKTVPYQSDYDRKAFRAPRHPSLTLRNRSEWLSNLLSLAGRYQADVLS